MQMTGALALRCAACMLGQCECTGRGNPAHVQVIAETVINGTALCAHCAYRTRHLQQACTPPAAAAQ